MREPSITTKIGPDALAQLRLLADASGQKQIRILNRLVAAEFERLLRTPAPRARRERAK
jgi:hypothetical protein